jgi:amino acid adenylation domain-containing protein
MNSNVNPDKSAVSLLEQIVGSSPERLAVKDSEGSVTYGQMWERAGEVAGRLVALGVRPGDLVGLCLPRSSSLIVAALGIFRAGAAYVAIDPAYPDERLQWMLSDSAPVATVTDSSMTDRLGHREQMMFVGADARLDPEMSAGTVDGLPSPPSAENLAYVVYTSGSSGRPKGAMIDHAGLLNLVEWHRGAFDLGPNDRSTQIVSPGFDAAVLEIWPALAVGAAIHIVPEALRADPIGLRDWLVAEEITFAVLPTAVAETVIGLTWPTVAPLRWMLIGGDALTRRPAAGLKFSLVNSYGVSEASVVSTAGVVSADGERTPSIGRPIDGVTVEIVDDDLEPLPIGRSGELLIGGESVGRGYLNQPELTAERFVEDKHGRRLYRTGDHARIDADGEIEFLGRLDDQLSIRGFRVETGEVATALNSHPGVEASVAVAVGESSAERRLVAYLVAAGLERPSDEDVSTFLNRSLPDYMVPSTYVWLDRLPVTQHGKVDRKALPDPAQANQKTPSRPAERPTGTDVRQTIASIAAELLEVPEVTADQSFFLLGGHSMLAAQMIVRLEDLYGAEIGLRYFFDHPTPADLAIEVERQIADGAEPEGPISAIGSPSTESA